MIKINRTEKPAELTEEVQQELTDEFKRDKTRNVWNKPYIRNALFKMSNGKCCYCEVKLAEEGKDMHVEHFHPKSKYPDEVVNWENLLPACKRCNGKKSTHDTYEEEIINPCIDNPKDYLYMSNYWYKCKNNSEEDRKKAKDTIDVLSLNDLDGLIMPRFKIGNEVEEKIKDLLDKMEEYKVNTKKKIQQKNKIVNGVSGLLRLAQNTQEYSATIATVIIGDEDYKTLKAMMKECDLWNDELTNLEKATEEINLNLR